MAAGWCNGVHRHGQPRSYGRSVVLRELGSTEDRGEPRTCSRVGYSEGHKGTSSETSDQSGSLTRFIVGKRIPNDGGRLVRWRSPAGQPRLYGRGVVLRELGSTEDRGEPRTSSRVGYSEGRRARASRPVNRMDR